MIGQALPSLISTWPLLVQSFQLLYRRKIPIGIIHEFLVESRDGPMAAFGFRIKASPRLTGGAASSTPHP